jgi:hypothetical protein
MGHGARGRFDEKQLIYPVAPFFSAGGHRFLTDLSTATESRLRYSLKDEREIADRRKWELLRLRAPDAGRILWAVGKLKWRNRNVRFFKCDVAGHRGSAARVCCI